MPGPPRADWLVPTAIPARPQCSASMLACASLACILAVTVAAPAEGRESTFLVETASQLGDLARQGLGRHPSVMLAGMVALAIPVVGIVAELARFLARLAQRRAVASALVDPGKPANACAWLEVADGRYPPVHVGELVRIGDGDDCELPLAGAPGGGTCAIIQRTPECEFILFDVSAGVAPMAVNGALSDRCRLADGDRIEIGGAFLVFRTGESDHAMAGSLTT